MGKSAMNPLTISGGAGDLDMRIQNPGSGPARADILFVHGAWSSVWYWETFMMPYFAERGFRTAALSLRGHGASDGKLRWASVKNYVDDVRAAAQKLDNPIIVGHSMGGFVTQKYAQKYGARGVVLMASVPPQGAWHALFKIIRERPKAFLKTLATLDLFPIVEDPDTARGLIFSRDETRKDKDHLMRHLQSESFRAFIDMLYFPVRGTFADDIPRLVMGGEFDQVISIHNVEQTAKRHKTAPVIMPMMSHMLPLDDRWSDTALVLENWLETEILETSTPRAADLIDQQPTQGKAALKADPRYPPHVKRRAKLLGQMQYKPLTLSSILEHVEEKFPDKKIWSRELASEVGKVGPIHETTWGEIATRSRKLVSALADLGVQEGDRVASIAWNTHRHLETYYGVTGIGAVLHTINPRLPLAHIKFMLDEAGDKIVFYDGTFAGLVSSLRPMCPGVEKWIQMSTAPQAPHWIDGDTKYEDLLSGSNAIESFPELDEHGAAALCYTSGTTGNPKGVLYSHRALVLESLTTMGRDVLDLSRDDTVSPIVPMFHVNAWSLPFGTALAGSQLALPGPALHGEALVELFNASGTTMSAGVPTIWQSLLDYMDENALRFETMRRTVIGGSAVPPTMIRKFRDGYDVEVIHGWGMTETSPVGSTNSLTPKEAATLSSEQAADVLKRQGRAPYGVNLKLLDDSGKPLPQGGAKAGHLAISGHWVIDSYFGQTESIAPNGWFDTGDIAEIDDSGVMTITDRDKDLIKSGGEWISSVLLEEIALSHPDVSEAAAIAVPHPKWDERPLVVAVPKPGTTIDGETLKAHFAPHVATWQIPDVVQAEQLPLGATGKVLKADLRKTFSDYHST